jgi:hypothetical protein
VRMLLTPISLNDPTNKEGEADMISAAVKYHPKFPPSYHLKLPPRLKPVRLGKCEKGHPVSPLCIESRLSIG